MWKLDFYVLPPDRYGDLNDDIILDFDEKARYLSERENLYVPDSIFSQEDRDGLTLEDFLFVNEQSDSSALLREIILKQRMCSDTYDEIEEKAEYGYLPVSTVDIPEETAPLCVGRVRDIEEEKCRKVNDVVRIKRLYIVSTDNYSVYEDRARVCYPDLFFHDDAFLYASEMGSCMDMAEELSRHLAALNDAGRSLYLYYGQNEKSALSELKAKYKIECSGKGSNEGESYNKEITYGKQSYQLTCNPHTKLHGKRTDERIYFCWGRIEIESHKIIIVRIGGHWKK